MASCCVVRLKVPITMRKKLCKILKHVQNTIKFEELVLFIEAKYKSKLELFSSNVDEIVLEVKDTKDQKLIEPTLVDTKEELEEFKDLLGRIDFSDTLKNALEPLQDPNYTKKCIEIEISIVNEVIEKCTKNFFDCYLWKIKNIHTVYIGHIYDPSKFWITFNRVDVFQNQLFNFYEENGRMLDKKDVRNGLDCVVANDVYYRGRIVRTDIQDSNTFRVFLYDFGTVAKVELSQLYYLDESFAEIPAFAVRAMLSNISTLDEGMWTLEAVNRFKELTDDKRLKAEIVGIHTKRKILEINLFDMKVTKHDKALSINYRLVHDGFAKIAWHSCPKNLARQNNQYKPIRDFLYLLPPFEMIESGVTPSVLQSIEELKRCAPWDVIFPDFYRYENAENGAFN